MAFDKKLFIWLSVSFIAITAAGTLLHESAHYLTAKSLGYAAQLHYGLTTYEGVPENSTHSFYITLAGPLQTMLIGTIGILFLLVYRKNFQNKTALSVNQWAIVFTTLFWLRQVMNFAVWMGGYWLNGNFSDSPDEIRLAQQLELPVWSITCLTAITGLIILAWVFFKFIPDKQKMTFILSGFTGGLVGYVLWLKILGPLLMP